MNDRFRTWIVISALCVAPGCVDLSISPPAIPGSGIAKEETRAVEAFHQVEAGSTLLVTVKVTPGAKPGLKLSGDDNLVPLIESVVRNGTLVLRTKDNATLSSKLPMRAEVETAELDRVESTGAATVKVIGGPKADQFTAEVNGGARLSVDGLEAKNAVASADGVAELVLTGTVGSLKAEASGASVIKAEALKAGDAHVTISGASSMTLRASGSVTGDVSGASGLELHGAPASNTVSTSGASSVKVIAIKDVTPEKG